jgi:hypothetical protein
MKYVLIWLKNAADFASAESRMKIPRRLLRVFKSNDALPMFSGFYYLANRFVSLNYCHFALGGSTGSSL